MLPVHEVKPKQWIARGLAAMDREEIGSWMGRAHPRFVYADLRNEVDSDAGTVKSIESGWKTMPARVSWYNEATARRWLTIKLGRKLGFIVCGQWNARLRRTDRIRSTRIRSTVSIFGASGPIGGLGNSFSAI